MPNCFQLTRISKPEEGPVPLTKIDEEICAHLGEPVDPKWYCHCWYDVIGFGLATGKTFDDFIDKPEWTEVISKIAKFLKANFTSDAWAEIGRR